MTHTQKRICPRSPTASEISNWALPYVRAMVGADYIHGRGKVLAPLDNITRAEFAQIFYNIIGTYIVSKGTYDKDIKGSVLIRTDDVDTQEHDRGRRPHHRLRRGGWKNHARQRDRQGQICSSGAAAQKPCTATTGTNMPAVVVARVDDAVKVIYDRDSTLAVIDTIKVQNHRTRKAAQRNGSHFLRRFRTARSPKAAQRHCRGQSDCYYCSCSSICSGRGIQRES